MYDTYGNYKTGPPLETVTGLSGYCIVTETTSSTGLVTRWDVSEHLNVYER